MVRADSHCDMLNRAYDEGKNFFDKDLMFNVLDAGKYLPFIELCAVFVNSKYVTKEYDYGYERAKNIIENFKKEFTRDIDEYNLFQIRKKEDINYCIKNKKIGILLTVENLSAIGSDISKLDYLYENGIRISSLTWEDTNLIASGNASIKDFGISDFGRRVLNKMNNLGMILDVSHLSDNSFYDVMKFGYKKIIATHSCVRALCNTKRNLTDKQIKYIAKCGGLVGVCLYKDFIKTSNNKVTINDYIDHIVYVGMLVGIDKVCIGSDFDGMEIQDSVCGIEGIKDIYRIEDALYKRGFKKKDIEKVLGKNLKNFLEKNL